MLGFLVFGPHPIPELRIEQRGPRIENRESTLVGETAVKPGRNDRFWVQWRRFLRHRNFNELAFIYLFLLFLFFFFWLSVPGGVAPWVLKIGKRINFRAHVYVQQKGGGLGVFIRALHSLQL